MKLEGVLAERNGKKCELCQSENNLKVYEVTAVSGSEEDSHILICAKCTAQIDKKEELNSEHWKCLTTSMWNEVPGVQIVAWRMLNRLKNESWAQEALDMMYLDDEKLG